MITTNRPATIRWSFLLITAVIVTLFLYFIDEGRYSLEGLFTLDNSIAMSIYLVGMVLGLFLMAAVFEKRPTSRARTALVLCLGTVVGLIFGLLLVFGLGLLQHLA